MKTNKFLLTQAAILTLASPILSCTSCGKIGVTPDAETIAGYIFDPLDKEEITLEGSWNDVVSSWDDREWEAELFYDLFGMFNFFKDQLNLKNLYEDNTVGIKTNIARFGVEKENDKFYATFLGYVSFVFLKDYDGSGQNATFKKNDYIMLTVDIKDLEIKLGGADKPSFIYEYPFSEIPKCVGFFKIRQVDTEYLVYVDSIDTGDGETNNPMNHKNYVPPAPPPA